MMRALNRRLEVDGVTVGTVSRDALDSLGLGRPSRAATGAAGTPTGRISAWNSFVHQIVDERGALARRTWRHLVLSAVSLAVAALVAIPFALVLTQATRDSPAVPVLLSVLTTCAGAIAALLILYRIANQPGPNDVVEVEAGAWLAFLAAVVVTAGGWGSMRAASSSRPTRCRPTFSAPKFWRRAPAADAASASFPARSSRNC